MFVRKPCPCKDFNVKCTPHNSKCINGTRFVPIEAIDVAGLVPDAYKGRGLGNKFLDDIRQAHALIHIVDASGGTDTEGNPCGIGKSNPIHDVEFLEKEITYWLNEIIKKSWETIARRCELEEKKIESMLAEKLTGLGIKEEHIYNATDLLKENGIKFMLQNIIGLPTGTLEEDMQTLEMNIRCKPDYAWVSIFQPYPGTRLGEYCQKNGLYLGNFKGLENNFFSSSKLNFSEEYKNQLSNLQKLFAIFVEYPELHNLGLTKVMINGSDEKTKEAYAKSYLEFRNKCDERLYGFKL
jgi:hypothetical protein